MVRKNEPHISPATTSDHALTGAVRNALANSEEVDTSDILVDAANGVIQLNGAVRTLHAKQVAGRIARSAPQALRVDNNLVVVSDRQPTADEIECSIAQALGDYPAEEPARIGVRMVEDGVAYLTGDASSALEAWRAADMAARVPGVKDVVNEIDIAPGEPMSDVDIHNLVIDALSEDPAIDPFEIEVTVKDGDVCLDGEVADDEAKRMAGERASGADGVKHVVNRLHVRGK